MKYAIAAAALLSLGACHPPIPPASIPAAAADAALVAEAETFMADYARELLAGDRAAVAARYDRGGAHLLHSGSHSFDSYEEIVAFYGGADWGPPAAFEWRDLAYEPAGPDAVVVVGQFVWTGVGRAAATYSYSALLRRRDGALRIRVEDEAPSAPPSP
jgi:hypothetical protein